jgi:hypothetical protein
MSETEASDFTSELPAAEARQSRASAGKAQAVSYGNGGGTEARIASIEAHVDHMRDDLGDMRRDLREMTKSIISAGNDTRELDDRISHLPGRAWMFLTMLLIGAGICAVIIYVEQIREYLGVLLPTSAP